MKNRYRLISQIDRTKRFKIMMLSLIAVTVICIVCIVSLTFIGAESQQRTDFKEVNSGAISGSKNDEKYLTLVNDDNPVKEDFPLDLVAYNEDIFVDREVKPALQEMFAHAENSGYRVDVVGGYLTSLEQQLLYDNKVSEWMSEGYSRIRAESKAMRTESKGSNSDRETGLSVIIGEVGCNEEFASTGAYKWISSNCANYGFILRYAKDKEIYTGKEFRADYLRYVGRENALKLRSLNACLEEYVDYLEMQKRN